MQANELLIDAFGRIKGVVHSATKNLSEEELAFRPKGESNSIAWLVWHLTRIQDDHMAGVANREQVWTSGGWHKKFGLPFNDSATGYGHSSKDVAAIRVSADLLQGYHDVVFDQTIKYLKTLQEKDFDKVIDKNWDPPVTLGVRLISVISDDLQHAGQAAYVRGLL